MNDYKEKFQLKAHTNTIRHRNFILIYIVIILILTLCIKIQWVKNQKIKKKILTEREKRKSDVETLTKSHTKRAQRQPPQFSTDSSFHLSK